MLISKKKKKVLDLSSPTFLRDFYDIPERGTVNCSCLRFLAGNKNAGFWQEKKRRNSQNFSAKMPEKISHFFALIRNTGDKYRLVIMSQNYSTSIFMCIICRQIEILWLCKLRKQCTCHIIRSTLQFAALML